MLRCSYNTTEFCSELFISIITFHSTTAMVHSPGGFEIPFHSFLSGDAGPNLASIEGNFVSAFKRCRIGPRMSA